MKITSKKIDKVIYVNGYPNEYYGTQYYLCIWGYEFPIYFEIETPTRNDWDDTPQFDRSINK